MQLKKNTVAKLAAMRVALTVFTAPTQADTKLAAGLENEIEELATQSEQIEGGDAALDEAALTTLGQQATKLKALKRRLEAVNSRLAAIDMDDLISKRIAALKKNGDDEASAVALKVLQQVVEDAEKKDCQPGQWLGEAVQALYLEALTEIKKPHLDRAIEALKPLYLGTAKAREMAVQTDLIQAFYPAYRFQSTFDLRLAERAAEVFADFIAGKDPVDFEAQRAAADQEAARLAKVQGAAEAQNEEAAGEQEKNAETDDNAIEAVESAAS